jgi:hypothetical protein
VLRAVGFRDKGLPPLDIVVGRPRGARWPTPAAGADVGPSRLRRRSGLTWQEIVDLL